MKIERFAVGSFEANGYVIYQEKGGDCLIIDPGAAPGQFIDFIDRNELNVIGILLTHHHFDHVGAVKKIKALKGCNVYLHSKDLKQYGAEVNVVMKDGDMIMLEDEAIKVLHTPGHTEGGVCLFSEKSKLVFTGDTIFNVDLGRTDLEDGDPYKMLATMKNIVNTWEDEIMIYPGHGDPCDMKFVRRVNMEFLDAIAM